MLKSLKSRRILIIGVVILAGVGMVALIFGTSAGSALAKGNETNHYTRDSAMLPTLQTTPTEYGTACINDYQPGSVCTANDVRVVAIQATDVITPCTGEGTLATAQYVFDIRAQAQGGSPNRYDIGIFVDLDGVATGTGNKLQGGAQLSGEPILANNADGVQRTKGCYHTILGYDTTPNPIYAEPPDDRSLATGGVTTTVGDGVRDLYDGPWWDGTTDSPAEDDLCGDIESGTQLFKTIDTLQFVCTDSDGDGNVDLSVCTSWDNQTGSYCANVDNAWPNTKSKCSCGFINFPFTPTGITLGEINASTTNQWLLPIVGILLVLSTVTIVVLRKRANTQEIA